MPRVKSPVRPVEKKINLPEILVAQVDLQLFSPLESRVPHGAWSKLVQSLLMEWLQKLGKVE